MKQKIKSATMIAGNHGVTITLHDWIGMGSTPGSILIVSGSEIAASRFWISREDLGHLRDMIKDYLDE